MSKNIISKSADHILIECTNEAWVRVELVGADIFVDRGDEPRLTADDADVLAAQLRLFAKAARKESKKSK